MTNSQKLKLTELKRPDLQSYKKTGKAPIRIVLDNVRSGINVGSIFRTADAFRIEKIFLCGITPVPPNKEILKSALGATESVDWEYCEDGFELVRSFSVEKDVRIVSIEQVVNSISLEKNSPEANISYVLVFGNEIEGVDQRIIDQSDACIEIPQFGTKHSFNVAVSAGIVLWDFYSKIYFKE